MTETTIEQKTFIWEPQPQAALIVRDLLNQFKRHCPAAQVLETDLLEKTGTRLIDWVDHLAIPDDATVSGGSVVQRLKAAGFTFKESQGRIVFTNHEGMFPEIEILSAGNWRLAVKVEDVTNYLVAHGLDSSAEIQGAPCSPLRKACVCRCDDSQLWVVERHGALGWEPEDIDAKKLRLLLHHREALRLRQRNAIDDADGFFAARTLIRRAVADIGVNRTCDLFFAAEREYWQSRNHAARVQKARQDRLGMGWANHDHHTYRSSRECFAELINSLEELGFQCRERFYAGQEAGWGAQVLQQPACGVVIFADVDLAPNEVMGDFAHLGLSPSERLGTVGVWCKLHGEAFLKAGMHHLECQFDFKAATKQLKECGVDSMAPFTDFPFLKQAFTKPEIWQAEESRIDAALQAKYITPKQAKSFRESGAVGSHLEILERNDGYKGFNQTGISHIIQQTDPRKQAAV